MKRTLLIVLSAASVAAAGYAADRNDVFGAVVCGLVAALSASGVTMHWSDRHWQKRLKRVNEDFLRQEFERRDALRNESDITLYRVTRRWANRVSANIWEAAAQKIDLGKYRKHLN